MIFKKENALDFNCESCGSCCKHFNVNITHLDIQRILENRKDLTVDDFVTTTFSEDKEDNESFISTYGKRNLALKKKKNSNECLFLDGNRCSIHFFKPLVCRVWPFAYEDGKITWIKEHKGFIKKVCQHTMKEGANNPEEIKNLTLWHYKERKLLAKITQKWNDEKRKELSLGETFTNIYDQDFIDFVIKEINFQSETEKLLEEDEKFLEKVLKNLSENMRVEAITETKSSLVYEELKEAEVILNVYIQEQFIESFISKENLDKLSSLFEADSYTTYNSFYQSNKMLFLINSKMLILNINSFNGLYDLLPFDTKIIYNPYKVELKIKDFKTQQSEELQRLKSIFKFKKVILDKCLEQNNILESKHIIDYMTLKLLLPVVYWLNGKNFSLREISLLKNKTDDLQSFLFESLSIVATDNSIETIKSHSKKLIDIFERNLKIADIELKESI